MSALQDPPRFVEDVTPSDATVFPSPTTCLYVSAAGDITLRMAAAGNDVTFPAVPVGWFPIQCDKVYLTGTTATLKRGW